MTHDSKNKGATGKPVPSVDDQVAALLRVLAVRLMLRRHGGVLASWPENVRAQYQLMMSQQAEYEATFGRDSDSSGVGDDE